MRVWERGRWQGTSLRVGAVGLRWALLSALWPASAGAHPFDADLYGQQVRVSVDDAALHVEIVAEVPTRVVLEDAVAQLGAAQRPTPAQRAAFTARWLTEITDGYRLFVNGERVPWSPVPVVGENGVGDAKFINYRLHLSAPLAPGALNQINLIDDNFPDQRAVRSVGVALRPGWRLDACSLIGRDADGALVDRSGAWSALNEDRELRLSVQPRAAWRLRLAALGHGLGAAGAPDTGGWLAGSDALFGQDAEAVQRGWLALVAGGAALIGGALAAVAVGRRSKR